MDKKLETKRLFIYLALSFGLTWIIFFAYILSGNIWAADGEVSGKEQFISLGMLVPALAALLTRYITKEGFAVTGKDSLLLGICLKDRKWVYFAVAMLLPWIYFELGYVFTILISPETFDTAHPALLGITEQERAIIFIEPIAAIISGTLISFAAYGEEAGWRGYMMPKMIKLWGVRKAVVIGGIIWGIWHWPLTYVGHNFGRDYFGYPFTGFAAMCVMCVFLGMILTYITYKSGSIWPAAFLHAINNASPSILRYFVNYDKISGWRADSVAASLISLVPMIMIAIFIYIKFQRSADSISASL